VTQSHHPSTPVYPIGKVEELTGLSARQLRYYEQRGIVEPGRSAGNQRLYSPAQVELLRKVRAYLDQGLNLAGMQRLLREAGRELPLRTARHTARPAAEAERDDERGHRHRSIDEYPGQHILRRHGPGSMYPLVHPEELLRKIMRKDKDQSSTEDGTQ